MTRALALDIVAGQLARPEQQHRQRCPRLAVEMRDTVEELLPDMEEATVDMRLLPATGAERAGQVGAAIGALVMRVGNFGGIDGTGGIDRPSDQAGVDQAPHGFDAAAHQCSPAADANLPGNTVQGKARRCPYVGQRLGCDQRRI